MTRAAKARVFTFSVARDLPRGDRRRFIWFGTYAVIVTILFIYPLARLVSYASQTELHSHVPLIPLVSAYLLYVHRVQHREPCQTSVLGTVVLGALSLLALAASRLWAPTISLNDGLALTTLSWLSALSAGGFLLLGTPLMSAAAFPFAFLLFLVPMPDAMAAWLERVSVLASSEVTARLLSVTGTPFLREGTVFALPGIVLEVARECSGIRSSWVLFITSLVASHLLLKSTWRRSVLVAFVIPLGIVRNGFRILVIGLLCVHVGPEMIDSPIHHQGGPLFFVLSLVPLFLFLWWLRRSEP